MHDVGTQAFFSGKKKETNLFFRIKPRGNCRVWSKHNLLKKETRSLTGKWDGVYVL